MEWPTLGKTDLVGFRHDDGNGDRKVRSSAALVAATAIATADNQDGMALRPPFEMTYP